MTDDDDLSRQLDQPTPAADIERMETLVEFEVITNPGHWCPACGQEQPADPGCPECFTTFAMLNDADVADMMHAHEHLTTYDLRDIYWLWRS